MAAYDPDYVRGICQEPEREWGRFEHRGPAGRASLHLHSWHLRRHIRAGDRVLDVGAGPGRFTIELARLGACVTVGDLSPQQLEANRRRVEAAGLEDRVEARAVMDVVDLSPLPSNSFDAVVCYGGALSYVFERADDAVGELLRVTRPGGVVLLSVMSLLGSMRHFLGPCLKLARQHGPQVIHALLATRDQVGAVAGESPDSAGHRFRYYTWTDLRALLDRHPCEIVDATAANFLAVGGNAEQLRPLLDGDEAENAALWHAFLEWEVASCRQPGAIDGGTHIIAVARKASLGSPALGSRSAIFRAGRAWRRQERHAPDRRTGAEFRRGRAVCEPLKSRRHAYPGSGRLRPKWRNSSLGLRVRRRPRRST